MIGTEEIAEIVKVAAAEVLARKDEILDEEYDARYHDVNLLMKNYRKLKAYYSHVSPETLEVSAICSMRRKTGLMMSTWTRCWPRMRQCARNPSTRTRDDGGRLSTSATSTASA